MPTLAAARGRVRLLAINDAYKLTPWADALYACDGDWWAAHKGAADFPGQRWTQDFDAARRWSLAWVRSEARPGLSPDPRLIHQGSNSTYQGMNLLAHFGIVRVLLCGVDMKATGGKSHWFGDHPGHLRRTMNFARMMAAFAGAAADLKRRGIEVINCTPGSALRCFPDMELECALSA